jgi:hypothetical protein
MKLASLKQHSLLYPLEAVLLRRFAKGLKSTSKTTPKNKHLQPALLRSAAIALLGLGVVFSEVPLETLP